MNPDGDPIFVYRIYVSMCIYAWPRCDYELCYKHHITCILNVSISTMRMTWNLDMKYSGRQLGETSAKQKR